MWKLYREKEIKRRHILLYCTMLLAFVASFRIAKGISNQRQCLAECLRNLEIGILQGLRFGFITKVAVKIIVSPCSLVESYQLLESYCLFHFEVRLPRYVFNPYPTAFPYGNGMVLHFYQQQESSTTKTVHKVINKGLKAYV